MDYSYFPYAKRCKIEPTNEWERPPSNHGNHYVNQTEQERMPHRPPSGAEVSPDPPQPPFVPSYPSHAPTNMFPGSPSPTALPHHNFGNVLSSSTPPLPHHAAQYASHLSNTNESKPYDQCMYNLHNFNGTNYCDPNYSSSMFTMPMYGAAGQGWSQRCDTGNVACAYGQNSLYDYRNMGHMANTDSQNMYFQQTGHPYVARSMFDQMMVKRESDCTNLPPDRGRPSDGSTGYSYSPTQHMSPHAALNHQYHMAPQMHNIKTERMPMGYHHGQITPHGSPSPNNLSETCVYHSLLESDSQDDENPDRKTIYNFIYGDPPLLADQYLLLEQQLCFRLRSLLFPEPVSHIYCPLDHAFEPHADFVRKYCHRRKEVMFLGMNPGPFGMVQSGVPFGEVEIVKDWLKVSGNVFKPRREHPQRPVLGMECKRSEVSGARFWGLLREICGEPETFFNHCFIHNHCPLAFMSVTGKNITPPKLPVGVRKALNEACDQALRDVMRLLGVKILVGVGKFAQERAKAVLSGEEWSNIRIETIMHPSPINPAANKGWNEIAKQQLKDIGVWQYMYIEPKPVPCAPPPSAITPVDPTTSPTTTTAPPPQC